MGPTMRAVPTLLLCSWFVAGADAVGEAIDDRFKAEYQEIAEAIVDAIQQDPPLRLPLVVRQTWHTAAHFNAAEDRPGGTDGACQRFETEASHASNNDLGPVRDRLQLVKDQFSQVSWADLYVLSGNTALELMGAPAISFCPGRVDFTTSEAVAQCPVDLDERMPKTEEPVDDPFPHNGSRDYLIRKFGELGIDTVREIVALMAGGHGMGRMHRETSGHSGAWGDTTDTFDLAFCQSLNDFHWQASTFVEENLEGDDFNTLVHDKGQYVWTRPGSGLATLAMLKVDVVMKHQPEFSAVCAGFLANEQDFRDAFASAWGKLMTNGVTTLCDETPAPAPTTPTPTDVPSTSGTADRCSRNTGARAPPTDAPATPAPATIAPPCPTPTTPTPATSTPAPPPPLSPYVVVSAAGGLVTSEGGLRAEYTLKLTTRPESMVMCRLTSSDRKEGRPTRPWVIWRERNWDTVQTVTVAGVDDNVLDGDVLYTISTKAVSRDRRYRRATVPDVTLTNLDNEGHDVFPGVVVETGTEGPLCTTERRGTHSFPSFSFHLVRRPASAVAVLIYSEDSTEGVTLPSHPARFIVKPDEWDKPVRVQVQGVDDSLPDGDVEYQLRFALWSLDRAFRRATPPRVACINMDDGDVRL
eukprot:TRINITY_DN1117_c0_g1_i3.p1 TRINITY_DN1117_c0_g1~~TRINITY_DN1117_c0_g1_i3.p1  ORF type:complete len:640 (+),score=118.03 TRINITY_DN1117_c0_g1_i3:56-1975(+)